MAAPAPALEGLWAEPGPPVQLYSCAHDTIAARAKLDDAELTATPLHLPGLVRGSHPGTWPACDLWAGPQGMDRLDALIGDAHITAMFSSSSTFVGLLSEYKPTPMRMRDFLREARSAARGAPGPFLYLAQHMLEADSPTVHDAPPPPCLGPCRLLTSTNLWMCLRGSRSNIHYDPYENLLVVAVGAKRVRLWPAACTPCLYPAPLPGDGGNHSTVDFTRPDFDRHPLFAQAEAVCQEVALRAGDALYIPAGYWHQVDSDGITVAVNFWWASAQAQALARQPHQTVGALRLVAAEALGQALSRLLRSVPPLDLGAQETVRSRLGSSRGGSTCQGVPPLSGREAAAAAFLSACACACSGPQSSVAPLTPGPAAATDTTATHAPMIDPVSRCLAALSAGEAVHVLYVLSVEDPDATAALLTSQACLTPLAAHLLTARLEQADEQGVFCAVPDGDQECRQDMGWDSSSRKPLGAWADLSSMQFYQQLYGRVPDAEQVFARLLQLREQLASGLLSELLRHVLT